MSKSEDYLDGLLNSVENGRASKRSWEDEILEDEAQERATLKEKPKRSADDDFFDSFEQELLLGGDSDDFLRQFERELQDDIGSKTGRDSTAGREKAVPPKEATEEIGFSDAADNAGSDDFSEGPVFGSDDAFDGMGNFDAFSDSDISGDTGSMGVGEPDGAGDISGDFFGAPDISGGIGDIGGTDAFGALGESSAIGADDTFGSLGDAEISGDDLPKDPFLDNLDSIVNDVKEGMADQDPLQTDGSMDIMVDTIGDMSEKEGESEGFLSAFESIKEEPGDDFSEIGDLDVPVGEGDGLIDAGMDGFDALEVDGPGQEDEKEDAPGGKRKKRKKKDSGENMSFAQKLSRIFFGEDDEEEDGKVQIPGAASSDIENLDDENMQILKELGETGAQTKSSAEDDKKKKKKEEKEKKAKEKKEKKEQKKKEKSEKKAKKPPKEKKEKKPKPPKVRDNTPPLPKVPVLLIFLMAGSFLALILIGTNLFGYSNSFEEAARDYGLGNYEEAYRKISGMELEEKDQDIFERYRIMANAAGQYSAYQTFMESGVYDMALDSLIRTVGRCEKYRPDAEYYGCVGELDQLRGQASGALSSFGISEERALELYENDDRSEYSEEVYRILIGAGLQTKVEK